mmetsp:Transcript_83092/g.253968  ORF Transcript_83092/g.253968 Transcript_83092/m.253968 type:complete len:206 (-) Transcript_83092:773-1390(-)
MPDLAIEPFVRADAREGRDVLPFHALLARARRQSEADSVILWDDDGNLDVDFVANLQAALKHPLLVHEARSAGADVDIGAKLADRDDRAAKLLPDFEVARLLEWHKFLRAADVGPERGLLRAVGPGHREGAVAAVGEQDAFAPEAGPRSPRRHDRFARLERRLCVDLGGVLPHLAWAHLAVVPVRHPDDRISGFAQILQHLGVLP